MEKTQRSSRKRGCGILAIVILVIIVSAIGGVLIKAATYKPKTEADAKLYEIASMFGKSRLGFSILDMFLDLTPDQQMKEDIYRTVTGIQDEIDACGVDPDFMAPPAITGDNLFDAYAGEVDRLLNTPLRSKEDVLEAALIPEEVLGGWEERFGDDPRYWELRYLLAKTHDLGSRNTGNSQVSSTTANAVQYLEEAHSRGVASANTLLLLYAEQVEAGEAALEGLTTYDPAQGYWRPQAIDEQLSNRPEFTPEILDQAQQIHAENDSREAALLEEAVALGSNEAWPYYMRGLHRVSLGEYREGLADIQAGNAATINSYPRPFPIEFMEDTLGTGQPAGGPGVCGAVQVILVGYPRPDFIELKDHFREAVIAAELGYGPDVYQTWHKFACRFSQSWPSDTILSLTALANTSMLRSSYLDNHRADLDADQLAAFNRLNGAMEALRVRARRFGEYDSLSASILLLGLDKKRGMPVAFYLQAESDYRRNRDMIQLFTELASFSYLELDCPAELEQYELLSDDLRSGRRLCRKKSYELNDEIDAAVAVINGNPPGQDDAESDASGE